MNNYTKEEKLLYLIPKLQNEHRDFMNEFDALYWELLFKNLFIKKLLNLSNIFIKHINDEKEVYEYLKLKNHYTSRMNLIQNEHLSLQKNISLITQYNANAPGLLSELEMKLMEHIIKEENEVFIVAQEIVNKNLI